MPTSPLPSPKPALPVPHVGIDGVPFTDYVRRIDFVDEEPPGADAPPVHVLGRVLLDGVATEARVVRDSITVDLGGGGTIVTMNVHAEDVQIGSMATDEPYIPHLIGGRHVLTPVGEGWEWGPVDPTDAADPYIVCSIYVATVHAY